MVKIITALDSANASDPDYIPTVVFYNFGSELSYTLADLLKMYLK